EGAPAIDVARLDSVLRPAARFLRLEAKLDPPEGWIDLAAEWPSPATVTRAAGELFRQGRHEDVVRLTESLELPQDTQQTELARRAMAAGNLGTARQAAQRLQQVPDARWRAEGLALAGEIGWVAGEVRTTQSAFDQLFSPGWRASERESRDLAAIQLAHAMVLVEAESGGRRAELEAQLALLRDRLPAKDAAQ